MDRRKLTLGIVIGELTVLLLLVANAWLQYDRDEERVVRQSTFAGQTVAEEARVYFRDHPEQRGREASSAFLRDLVTRRAPSQNETGEGWSFHLQDGAGSVTVLGADGSARPVVEVRRDGWHLFVSVPFGLEGDGFSGLLIIQHNRRLIAERSVLDPAWVFFQLVLFVFLSFQVCLTFVALARRDRVTVFEKGYLKEHAVGALKLQHRLLGQIIRDHEEGEAPAAPPAERARGKVIPLDKAARAKPSQDRGAT